MLVLLLQQFTLKHLISTLINIIAVTASSNGAIWMNLVSNFSTKKALYSMPNLHIFCSDNKYPYIIGLQTT